MPRHPRTTTQVSLGSIIAISGNVRLHAAGCPNPALQPKPEYLTRSLQSFIGKYVKIKFYAVTDHAEYMWVEVKSVDGDKLQGNLNQEPIACHHLKNGDEVVLGRDEIIDVFSE
jgi:hypothetical protein